MGFPASAPLCSVLSNKSKPVVLSYKSIVDVVRQTVPTDQKLSYSSHSFRRGGASYMYGIGMSVESIRLMGDWKSDCYQRYIQIVSSVCICYAAESASTAIIELFSACVLPPPSLFLLTPPPRIMKDVCSHPPSVYCCQFVDWCLVWYGFCWEYSLAVWKQHGHVTSII